MWLFQKKAEQPADTSNAPETPVPPVNDCCVQEEPVKESAEEINSAPVTDDKCIPSVPTATAPDAFPIPGLPEDDMTRDLALRVMEALSAWRTKYHLEKLPDKIVLTQALNILYVMQNAL